MTGVAGVVVTGGTRETTFVENDYENKASPPSILAAETILSTVCA